MNRSHRRWLRAAAGVAVCAFAAWTFDAASPWTLRVNTTQSLPRGLYLASAYRGDPLELGEIACFRYVAPQWAVERVYFSAGYPLCKYVLALPGERIEVTGSTVAANAAGRPARWLGDFVSHDARGLPVPRAVSGSLVLGAEQYWLGSLWHSRSFDSRYLGPIERSRIVFTLRPLVTF